MKKLMVDEDISQGQLAQDLGISPAMLSNYMTGKNIPEMKIVEKCIKRFKLQNAAVKDIFSKVLSSTAKVNRKIILDTRYFKEGRLDLLVQVITILLLFHPTLTVTDGSTYTNLEDDIKKFYFYLEGQEITYESQV
ncbi:MAG: helix-turn-helix domain-containing protein [Spirochaetaceae bacterium]|nr:helix-turn-helix domain-containing protein [Spirochaetaceae bacterium]